MKRWRLSLTCMTGLVRCGLLRVAGLPVEGISAGEFVRERGGGW